MFTGDNDSDFETPRRRGQYLYNHKRAWLIQFLETWGLFVFLLLVSVGTLILIGMLP